MALELNGTTGVSLVQDGVITDANLPAGSVLQVVQTTKNDTTSYATSGSFADISGMSVSITPSSASNKVLVMFSITIGNLLSDRNDCVRLLRDSTDIAIGTGGAVLNTTLHFRQTSIAYMQHGSMTFLDSPNTTSATTYKLQWRPEGGGTVYLNRRGNDSNFVTVSTITAMEIAG